VERLIRLAHVLLMPSEMESFGLAALEAMACGVPAVGTRVGGVPELITDGEDGFLEKVGDIEGQAARVVELLTDDALDTRMAAAARQTASTRFCTEKIIPLYEDYYEQILSGHSG
jgi:glycosyltransferase involved in cell wall biosynthesis